MALAPTDSYFKIPNDITKETARFFHLASLIDIPQRLMELATQLEHSNLSGNSLFAENIFALTRRYYVEFRQGVFPEWLTPKDYNKED